ncbi:MAG: hypothetical protein O3C21_09100 [Verrucomicrobia bacterium]|nr:hypothetical protein [Verrucomicrobiota bacterium]
MEPHEQASTESESGSMPDLDSQPLWIKIAAMTVAIGGILALVALYIVRC